MKNHIIFLLIFFCSTFSLAQQVLELSEEGAINGAENFRMVIGPTGITQIVDIRKSLDLRVDGSAGQLEMFNGVNGDHIVQLGSTSTDSDRGGIVLYGAGVKKVDLKATTGSTGQLWTWGANNTINTYTGSTADNHGYSYVADQNGTPRAAMYSDVNVGGLGTIVADIKNFKVPHPENVNMDIWFACVEGPEAGAYDRGTARLVNAEVFISYSDHYALISNPNTSTMQLTPHHWDTYGLAVVEKNDKGFRVKELKGGTGNFTFDWEVKSVRRGKENYEVLRPKNYIKSVTSEE